MKKKPGLDENLAKTMKNVDPFPLEDPLTSMPNLAVSGRKPTLPKPEVPSESPIDLSSVTQTRGTILPKPVTMASSLIEGGREVSVSNLTHSASPVQGDITLGSTADQLSPISTRSAEEENDLLEKIAKNTEEMVSILNNNSKDGNSSGHAAAPGQETKTPPPLNPTHSSDGESPNPPKGDKKGSILSKITGMFKHPKYGALLSNPIVQALGVSAGTLAMGVASRHPLAAMGVGLAGVAAYKRMKAAGGIGDAVKSFMAKRPDSEETKGGMLDNLRYRLSDMVTHKNVTTSEEAKKDMPSKMGVGGLLMSKVGAVLTAGKKAGTSILNSGTKMMSKVPSLVSGLIGKGGGSSKSSVGPGPGSKAIDSNLIKNAVVSQGIPTTQSGPLAPSVSNPEEGSSILSKLASGIGSVASFGKSALGSITSGGLGLMKTVGAGFPVMAGGLGVTGSIGAVGAAGAAGYGIGTLANMGINKGVESFTGGKFKSLGEAMGNDPELNKPISLEEINKVRAESGKKPLTQEELNTKKNISPSEQSKAAGLAENVKRVKENKESIVQMKDEKKAGQQNDSPQVIVQQTPISNSKGIAPNNVPPRNTESTWVRYITGRYAI